MEYFDCDYLQTPQELTPEDHCMIQVKFTAKNEHMVQPKQLLFLPDVFMWNSGVWKPRIAYQICALDDNEKCRWWQLV